MFLTCAPFPFKISFSDPKIVWSILPGAVFKVYVTVNVFAGSGWKKTYQGEGVDTTFSMRGLVGTFTKAANRSLADVVERMLTDKEFLSLLIARK